MQPSQMLMSNDSLVLHKLLYLVICLSDLIQGDTKKTAITKNRITSKNFLDWHKTSATLGQACAADISKVSSLYYKNSLFHWRSKNVLQMSSRRCRHIWIRRAKFSMTLPHSYLGIALIAAVIAAFKSGIVWGLLPYTLSLGYAHI